MVRVLAIISTLAIVVSFLIFVGDRIAQQDQSIQRSGSCVAIPASPNYLVSGSTQDAVAAINHARQYEHVHALYLPSHFYNMNAAQQQFVLLNLERTDRGLPALKLDNNLSQLALGYTRQLRNLNFFAHISPIGGTFAQRLNSNPSIEGHYRLAGENLAGNPVASAGAIYEYMYNDINESCGHRQNMLEPSFQYVGIAEVPGSQYSSISAQEFLSSAPWNPYHGGQVNPATPAISLHVSRFVPNSFLLLQANTRVYTGVARVTWFLDHIGTGGQLGQLWSLDLRHLSHGKHTIYAYVTEGMQNYATTSYSFQT